MAKFSKFLCDPALADRIRRSPTAFTRNRILTLPRMAALMRELPAAAEAENYPFQYTDKDRLDLAPFLPP